jgi:hypothetical protein
MPKNKTKNKKAESGQCHVAGRRHVDARHWPGYHTCAIIPFSFPLFLFFPLFSSTIKIHPLISSDLEVI